MAEEPQNGGGTTVATAGVHHDNVAKSSGLGSSRPQTPEEKADVVEFRSVSAPAESFKRLDDFGKWLFGGTAIVASLAAGLGAAGFGPLDGPQKILFAVAVLLVALSLMLIVWTLRPHTARINRWSRDDMNAKISTILAARGRGLRRAGYLFALALLLAGFVPIVPGHFRRHHPDGVTYKVDSGSATAVVAFANTKPRSTVRASFRVARRAPVALPRASTLSDGQGTAAITLVLSHVGAVRSVWVVRRWIPENGNAEDHDACLLAIPHAVKPPTRIRPKPKKSPAPPATPFRDLIPPC